MSRPIQVGDRVVLGVGGKEYQYLIKKITQEGIRIAPLQSTQESLLVKREGGWQVDRFTTPHTITFRAGLQEVSMQVSIASAIVRDASPRLQQAYIPLFVKDATSEPTLNNVTRVDLIPYELPYERNVGLLKRNNHFGQRKLFLNELLFLKHHVEGDELIVYPGSAPGLPTGYLASLFPNNKFLLVDPAPFNLTPVPGVSMIKLRSLPSMDDLLNAKEQVFLLQEYFTVEIAKLVATSPRKVLFISDIRTKATEDEPDTADILWNLAQQFVWVRVIQPKAYMLKFRHPFYDEVPEVFQRQVQKYTEDFELAKAAGIDFVTNRETKILTYLGGQLWLQPWAGIFSTEVRLIGTNPNEVISYGTPEHFENQLFYYNNIYRWVHPHIIEEHCRESSSGSPRPLQFLCADCAFECQIVAEYNPKMVPQIRAEIDRYTRKDLREHKCHKIDTDILTELKSRPPRKDRD